jgi:hypothetical protein
LYLFLSNTQQNDALDEIINDQRDRKHFMKLKRVDEMPTNDNGESATKDICVNSFVASLVVVSSARSHHLTTTAPERTSLMLSVFVI